MSKRIEIDGYSIYVEDIYQHNPNQYVDDASVAEKALKWTAEQINDAMKPAASILNSLRNATQKMAPDEMELSMQFEIALNGEVPVFTIVSAEAAAQVAVKFVWKRGQD